MKLNGHEILSDSEVSLKSESIEEELLDPNPGKVKNILFLWSKANIDRRKKLENEESLKKMIVKQEI